MAQLIDKQGLVNTPELPIISLEQFNAGEIPDEDCALRLNSDETADLVGENCQKFKRIDIDFPKFADGRGYSAARLLRERYGFTGELRSIGDVLIDQLFFMARCGFDSFDLREDQDIEDALKAFSTFSVTYQNDVHDQRPLFRRR